MPTCFLKINVFIENYEIIIQRANTLKNYINATATNDKIVTQKGCMTLII